LRIALTCYSEHDCNTATATATFKRAARTTCYSYFQQLPATATVTVNRTNSPTAVATIAGIFNYSDMVQVSGIFSNQNIMAKKLFLYRLRDIPIAQFPSVSREEPDPEVASSGG